VLQIRSPPSLSDRERRALNQEALRNNSPHVYATVTLSRRYKETKHGSEENLLNYGTTTNRSGLDDSSTRPALVHATTVIDAVRDRVFPPLETLPHWTFRPRTASGPPAAQLANATISAQRFPGNGLGADLSRALWKFSRAACASSNRWPDLALRTSCTNTFEVPASKPQACGQQGNRGIRARQQSCSSAGVERPLQQVGYSPAPPRWQGRLDAG